MAGRTNAISEKPTATRALVAMLLMAGASDALAQRTFYVDFANGNDAADGRSPETAWKRAPRDTKATDRAAAEAYQPGDRVLFKGGVRYRGEIKMRRGGSAEQPIIFDGSSWGSRRAIMDGSDVVGAAKRCPSQAACLGSEHWRNLMFVPVPADTQWSDWLFVGDHAMQMAQWPSIANFWDYDNIDKMATIPKAKMPELRAGFIAVPNVPPKLMAGSPVLGQWSNINDIYPARSFEIQAEGISFDSPAYKPFGDRDNKFVIYNTPSQVDAPGKFAVSGKDGIAIFWPRSAGGRMVASNPSVGANRAGFNMLGASHVRIRGFSFANFSSPQFGGDASGRIGVPLTFDRVQDGKVIDNAFRSIVNMTRGTVVRVLRGGDVEIARNSFTHLPWNTAVYISHTDGPVAVRCNRIRNVGRNGVRVINAKHTTIESNYMHGLNGIHGAGINLYLDNRYAMVRDNVIVASRFPLTMLRGKTNWFSTPEPVDLNLLNNVFAGNTATAAAISSWGGSKNVRIAGNFIGAGSTAILLARGEQNIQLSGNQIVGRIIKGQTSQLDDEGNVLMAADGNGQLALEQAAHRKPPQRYCGESGALRPISGLKSIR